MKGTKPRILNINNILGNSFQNRIMPCFIVGKPITNNNNIPLINKILSNTQRRIMTNRIINIQTLKQFWKLLMKSAALFCCFQKRRELLLRKIKTQTIKNHTRAGSTTSPILKLTMIRQHIRTLLQKTNDALEYRASSSKTRNERPYAQDHTKDPSKLYHSY